MIFSFPNSTLSVDHSSTPKDFFPECFESWMSFLATQDFLSDQGETVFLKSLQDHSEWVYQTNSVCETLLLRAAGYGHLNVVKALIQAGADFNAQDKDGWTALMYASVRDDLKLVDALIRAGVDMNLQNKHGVTALMQASNDGSLAMVKALIEADSDLNLQNNYGHTALIFACLKGHAEVVQELMNHGADPTIINNHQQTALNLAKENGHCTVVDYLESYADRQTLNSVIQTPETRSRSIVNPNLVKSGAPSKTPRL